MQKYKEIEVWEKVCVGGHTCETVAVGLNELFVRTWEYDPHSWLQNRICKIYVLYGSNFMLRRSKILDCLFKWFE